LGILDRSDLKDDPRFATQTLRANNEDIIDELVEGWTKTISKNQAALMLKECRVPAAPVRNLEEVTADTHMHQRGMLHKVQHPIMGDVVLPTSPIRFHESPDPSLVFEPSIGEHTGWVLSDWLGLDVDTVEQLKYKKVVV
jgi:crotonobetainyl-CoA:carnitine CoA-transferase CaiB-like acyl-CoA transferase